MFKIARDGAEIGEYDTLDEIYEHVATGAIRLTDFYWQPGDDDWQAINTLPDAENYAPVAPPIPASVTPPSPAVANEPHKETTTSDTDKPEGYYCLYGCLMLPCLLAIIFVVLFLVGIATNDSGSDIPPGFSEWDGSHDASVRTIKRSMKNPSSFEHVETRFNDNTVFTTYRGTNSFGGTVTETIATDRYTGAKK